MTAEEQRFVHCAAGLFDRSYRGVLDLRGKDVAKVMDGVFSSAVTKLAPGQGQPSVLLSAKGRLIAAFQLFLFEGDTLRLIFPEPLRDSVLKAIHKYAFLSDIALLDRSNDIAILSVEGLKAASVLQAVSPGFRLPEGSLEAREIDIAGVGATTVRAGESLEGGFELWVPRGALAPVSQALALALQSQGGGRVGSEAAEALRIEAGIARYGKDYDDESFPNDIGLESALTYDKCYVGQEIVARMRTYGQANRRLAGLLMEGARLPPLPGVLRIGGEEVGRVTSAAFSARLSRGIALGAVKRRFWEATSCEIDTPQGPLHGDIVKLPFLRFY